VHKQLNALFGSWGINIEFSDKLTAEFRHRYNQNMSQRRRANFLKFGHYDTWLVDELIRLKWEQFHCIHQRTSARGGD
jgi:hypothetical protein